MMNSRASQVCCFVLAAMIVVGMTSRCPAKPERSVYDKPSTASRATVNGVVCLNLKDENGDAVPKVRVRLTPLKVTRFADKHDMRFLTTYAVWAENNGYLDLPEGRWKVDVSPSVASPYIGEFTVDVEKGKFTLVQCFVSRVAMASLKVEVRKSTGESVRFVRVSGVPIGMEGMRAIARTDAQGECELAVPVGKKVAVRVDVPDDGGFSYEPVIVKVGAGENRAKAVLSKLETRAILDVAFVEEKGGEDHEVGEVFSHSIERHIPRVYVTSKQTNDRAWAHIKGGKAHISGIGPGEYAVSAVIAYARGYPARLEILGPKPLFKVLADAEDPVSLGRMEVTWPRGKASVMGRIVTGQGGTAGDVSLHITRSGADGKPAGEQMALPVDDNGLFIGDEITPGVYGFEVMKGGKKIRTYSDIVLVPGHRSQLVFDLRR